MLIHEKQKNLIKLSRGENICLSVCLFIKYFHQISNQFRILQLKKDGMLTLKSPKNYAKELHTESYCCTYIHSEPSP